MMRTILLLGVATSSLRVISKEGNYVLRARPESVNKKLAHLSAALRELDVIVLHKLLLEGALRMSEESIRNQEHIHYVREADEAILASAKVKRRWRF